MEKGGQSLSSFLLWDSESGMEKKSGSGINVPDPQDWETAKKTPDIPFYMYMKYLDAVLWLEEAKPGTISIAYRYLYVHR